MCPGRDWWKSLNIISFGIRDFDLSSWSERQERPHRREAVGTGWPSEWRLANSATCRGSAADRASRISSLGELPRIG